MTPIDRLIAADRETKKRVCVIGCSMEDVWLHGELQPSQDGVMKFVERLRLSTPGGAAGAARQLAHWNCDTALISLVKPGSGEAWNQVPDGYTLECRRMPTKTRYIDLSGRIVWRHDLDNGYGLDANGMNEARELALKAIRCCHWDAVLISDYEKGFVDEGLIRSVIDHCNRRGVPVVADAKREPRLYAGSVLKCNTDYIKKFGYLDQPNGLTGVIVTFGPSEPLVRSGERSGGRPSFPVADYAPIVNHVGAGDAFAAHLTLALAHGLNLEEAVTVAHSAGRVYVQHEHGRPPWPHEICRDLDPIGGKVVACSDLPALRKSIPGRIMFTNGCFRLGPHAGHAWLLQQAREQGDALVVGLNSDGSVRRIKPGKAILSSPERARILGSMSAVDWIVVYDEDDPCTVIQQLQPDVLVKGHDCAGQQVPGHDLVPTVWFAPESPFPRHSSDL